MSTTTAGGRVVWGGRWSGDVARALDGWTCDRTGLLEVLSEAAELVVLDPLSFPWEWMRDQDRDVPVVVALPDDLGAREIDLVLGDTLMAHLSPWDRLVEFRPQVRRALEERWRLCSEIWLEVQEPGRAGLLSALRQRSDASLVNVTTDLGRFVGQSGDLVTNQLVEFGAHQRGTLNVLLSLVSEGDVIADVGGHIGTFAVPLARRVGGSGHVVSVEGMPEHAALLARNVELNGLGDRVTVVERVVGAPGGGGQIGRPVYGNTGGSSFESASWRHPGLLPAATVDELREEVPLLKDTSLLKVDIEGAETAALSGAESLVATARPVIALEVCEALLCRQGSSTKLLDAWFSSHGYRLFMVAGPRNTRELAWELLPIDHLGAVADELFDVVAFPEESPRLADLDLRGTVG